MNYKKYLFETCRGILSLILCTAFLFVLTAESRSEANNRVDNKFKNKRIGSNAEIKPDREESEIDNFTVKNGGEISVLKTVAVDLLVPGGGHFYRGDYAWGFSFMLMKIGGFYSVYYLYGQWKDRESHYNSAKSSSLLSGDAEHYKREYDRAAQYVTFAVVGNIIIYTASIIMNLNSVKKNNENAYPTFDLGYSPLNGISAESMISVKFRYRF